MLYQSDNKLEGEKLAIKTSFDLNLLSITIKTEEQSKLVNNRRYLTDFLQNTCVPIIEVFNYPNYGMTNNTPLIQKNYKPMSPWEKAQHIQNGTYD